MILSKSNNKSYNYLDFVRNTSGSLYNKQNGTEINLKKGVGYKKIDPQNAAFVDDEKGKNVVIALNSSVTKIPNKSPNELHIDLEIKSILNKR